MLEGRGGTRWREAKEENWDNCNSIINKIYLKKNKGGEKQNSESKDLHLGMYKSMYFKRRKVKIEIYSDVQSNDKVKV